MGRALDEWAYRKGVKLNFIRLGKPIENAFAESFNVTGHLKPATRGQLKSGQC